MDWLAEGRAWQEDYLLRAFLMYNRRFEIAGISSTCGLSTGNCWSRDPGYGARLRRQHLAAEGAWDR